MKKGFTLIETLVVVIIMGVVITTVVGVMLNSLKAKSRLSLANNLESNGANLTLALRRIILNSLSSKITCPQTGVGTSLVVINRSDGQSTNLACLEASGQVASNSSNLLASGVGVSGCSSFISCDTMPVTGEVKTINFNFSLVTSSGGTSPESYVKRSFVNKVVIRNY